MPPALDWLLEELIEAQIVPAYQTSWEALGFDENPIDFDAAGVPFQALRKMAGNSFNQACFVAWQAFVLMKARPSPKC